MNDQPTRIRVSGPELHEKWMSTAATGMIDDLQAQVRIVAMEDGTEYEATFTEVAQQQAGLS